MQILPILISSESLQLNSAVVGAQMSGTGHVVRATGRLEAGEGGAKETLQHGHLDSFDADGDPITGANVQLLSWRRKKTGPSGGTYATTNDRGEYRAFNITPGDYRVSVTLFI